MNAQNGNVGTVNRAAHIQAAGQGNATVGRQLPIGKVFVKLIHHRLDHAGSIGGGGVAVNPALGMHRVGDGVAGSADCVTFSLEMLN